MPCATVHLHLADRILDHWESRPGRAPFPASHPGFRSAFLHGSLAPDMGFVPGVDRFVSELAHYHAPADLTRGLFRRVRTPEAQAFAWGWASHVIGDVILHPMVGRAVGERIHGDREIRMNAEEDLPTHVGMEVGLDLALLDRLDRISPPPPTPFFRDGDVELLSGALEDTYGLSWAPRPLRESHRRAVRLTAWWPTAIGTLARAEARGWGPSGMTGAAVRMVRGVGRSLARADSALRGFLRPLPPPSWLVDRVLALGDEIPERMDELVAMGPETMENRNLETGEEAGPGRGHPPSDAVAARVERLRDADPSSTSGPGPGPSRTVSGTPHW